MNISLWSLTSLTTSFVIPLMISLMISLTLSLTSFAKRTSQKLLTGDVDTLESLSFDSGLHWRCLTSRGPIHLWVPFEYQHQGAGVVIYVHGYMVNVDEAWRDYHLASQFEASRRNALFIAIEAPRGKADRVSWRSLSPLRSALLRCGFRLPRGPWVAIGHSGAYRTLYHWVNIRSLRRMILLDALYAKHSEFSQFVRRSRSRLILVSTETSERSLAFSRRFEDVLYYDALPDQISDLSFMKRRARPARLIYFKSELTHHDVAASGQVTPLVLQMVGLPQVRDKRERTSKPSASQENTSSRFRLPFIAYP